MGRRKAARGKVMLWAMFCFSLGLGIHIDVTLTCTTYPNILAEQDHPFITAEFLMAGPLSAG